MFVTRNERSSWVGRSLNGSILVLSAWLCFHSQAALGQIERIWLTHQSHDPSKVVVNWETAKPGNSVVQFGPSKEYGQTVTVDDNVTLHHVEIPLAQKGKIYHYAVSTGAERSADATFKAYPTDMLRVAIVADWQGKPKLDAIVQENVHLLLTAGDNIDSLHRLCGIGVKVCTKPYAQLIGAYPALFRSVPFMPALGNHDREIRPRGSQPPPEPVYDVEAAAFRKFFPLPDEGWKWHFDIPDFGVRFIALDLHHIQDMGTTWQTGHPFHKGSVQYDWYEKLMTGPKPPFVVTLHNERNGTMRAQEKGAWHKLFSQGTIVISGFGYFAERAEVDGFPYYNTSLSGKGDKYPDPKSQFFQSEDGYILLTFSRNDPRLTVEVKSLDGKVLDMKNYSPADK